MLKVNPKTLAEGSFPTPRIDFSVSEDRKLSVACSCGNKETGLAVDWSKLGRVWTCKDCDAGLDIGAVP